LAQRPPARRFFVLFMGYWLPVLAYATAVLVVGSRPDLTPPVRFEGADKVYHVLEYAGLGFLLARALRATLRVREPVWAAMMTIGIGGLVGLADELHQRVVPGREASVLDLMADLAGLVVAQLLYLATHRD
jgi:VanZ family protein